MKDYDELLVQAVESITSIRKVSEEEDFDGEPCIYYIFDSTGEPIKTKNRNHWRQFVNSSIAQVRKDCVRGKDGYEYEIKTVFKGLSTTLMWCTTARRKDRSTFSRHKLYGGNYADALVEHWLRVGAV